MTNRGVFANFALKSGGIEVVKTDYSIFDGFTEADTWQSDHDGALRRFYLCLNEVTSEPGFNLDIMGEYLKSNERFDARNTQVSKTIDDLVLKAWSVRDYLWATALILN